MKKECIEYLTDHFTNGNGDEHRFVIAAISEVFTEDDEPAGVIDNNGIPVQGIVKGLKIGYSICNPVDTFNEKLGVTIAVGRARKNSEYAILVPELGYINTQLVQAFLQQEANHFKNNPEYLIAGYKRK